MALLWQAGPGHLAEEVAVSAAAGPPPPLGQEAVEELARLPHQLKRVLAGALCPAREQALREQTRAQTVIL